MQAVGEVARRRNTSAAFSTLRRKDLESFIARQARWYKAVHKKELREVALTAWEKSKSSDMTRGATLYENVGAFGFPKSWNPSRVIKVAKIGDHTFFRELRESSRRRS